MDFINNKACIISVGVGGSYPAQIKRLERSLNFVGWPGDVLLWTDYPEGCPPHKGDQQYNFKVHAFRYAFAQGYTHVLWVDSSFWAVRAPYEIFDYINENGLYFFRSGYSLAQTATDKLLGYTGTSRNSLIDVPEAATGAIGINILNPKGNDFFNTWEAYMEAGLFGGSRSHDLADSKDEIFLHSRQDQSAASMALYQLGITDTGYENDWVAYHSTNHNPERVIFFIGGIP